MKTYSIIITIALIACLAIIFWPSEPSKSDIKLINQRDSLLIKSKRLQASYDLKAMHLDKLKGELLESKAVVKRSEEKLTQAKVKERIHLKQIKELTLMMSDLQADSALKYRFRDDPDSIGQKVIYGFARLDWCDSVRTEQSLLISSLRKDDDLCHSALLDLDSMNRLSRDQISILTSSLDIDKKVIEGKDKQIKKQRKKIKLLGIGIPVAAVIGFILAL